MSRNVKISAALVALFAVMIAAIVLTANSKDDDPTVAAATTTQAAPPTTTEAAPAPAPTETTPDRKAAPKDEANGKPLVVAPDPRTLGQPGDGKVTFTEFLDFECPACGAAYPLIEQLRQEYAGRVTFNVRYFPLPSHRNSMTSALAVEAAAQQGKLAQMYAKMFQTQQQWGGQQQSQSPLFREFAGELGLDMTQYDADVRSRETRKRVRRDFNAAGALELQGTPSFFINEQPITAESPEQLRGLLDAALAGRPLPAPAPHAPHGPDGSHEAMPTTEA